MKNKDNKLHILFASRLVPEKGVDILLDTIKQSLTDKNLSENIIWHIASDGTYASDIIKLADMYRGKVFFYGKIQQKELADIYREVDMLFMPSRFLETFGLTALEALSSGALVVGMRKGGLIDFIPEHFALDENSPSESALRIFQGYQRQSDKYTIPLKSYFSLKSWQDRIFHIFPARSDIFLLHDYFDRIGGAEAYIDFLSTDLPKLGFTIKRLSYIGSTSLWKRRIMFIFSLFAFWRGITLKSELESKKPDIIWMHSILRYWGYWGAYALSKYIKKHPTQVYLSHHDVGFLAPFPQAIYSEEQIPKSSKLYDFLHGLPFFPKYVALFKWIYISLIKSVLPQDTRHIIFSPFLEKHIKNHFTESTVIVLPHTCDEEIFHT